MTAGAGGLSIWLMPSQFAPHIGGVERVVADLAAGLVTSGHDVTVVTNRHPAGLPAFERIDGIPVVRIVWPAPSRSPKTVARALVRAARSLRELRGIGDPPDVVHVHCVSSQAPFAWWIARRSRVRLVVTTHGEFTGDANDIFARSRWARFWARRLLRAADVVTVPSIWVSRDADAVGLSLPDPVTVISNGFDVAAWRAVPSPPDAPTVGAWGRLSPEKGFDRLLDAWPRVLAARPDASLWIAGEGPERERLEAILPDRVRLIGPLGPDELRLRLVDTRTVVVPSRAEAFGLVAAEAAAAKRHVVHTVGTAMDDTLAGAGLAVDTADPDALAAAILRSFGLFDPPSDPVFRDRGDMVRAYAEAYSGE